MRSFQTRAGTLSPSWAAIALLGCVAVAELGVTSFTALTGGFDVDLGWVRVTSSDAWKPFLIAVLCACAAAWLFDRQTGALTVHRMPVRARRWLGVSLTAVALIPLWLPILGEQGFAFGHDVSGHVTYTYLFDRALQQGQFPVRWVEWIEPGKGQPLFNHYQVGLYYLVQGVHLVVPSLSLSLKLTVVLFWASGAAFMFLLFARYGWMSGAVAAIVFAWSRYLMLDGYVRGAYPELVAIGLVPGVLWSLNRFAHTGRQGFLCAFALASALLTVCHPPTALIAGPVCAMYVVYLVYSAQGTWRGLWPIVPASALAAGLTAFFTWPALWEMESVRIGSIASGGLDYRDHFLFPRQWLDARWWYGESIPGPGDQLYLRISRIQLPILAWAVALVAWGVAKRRVTPRTRELCWWLGVVVFALFMTTQVSAPVWEALPAFRFVLFPWRYLMLVAVACAAMAAIAFSTLTSTATRSVMLVCVVLFQWYLTRDYRHLAQTLPRIVMNIDDPAWAQSASARNTAYSERSFDPASAERAAPPAGARWEVMGGAGETHARRVDDHELSFVASTAEGMRVTVYTRYVPGWIVLIDGKQAPLTIDPAYGYMAVDIAAGHHRVDVRFTDTPLRRAANRLTVLSGVLWAAWTLVAVAGQWRRRAYRTQFSATERADSMCSSPISRGVPSA